MKKTVILLIIVMLFSSCSGAPAQSVAQSEVREPIVLPQNVIEEQAQAEPIRITFSAVGDNLIHDGIYLQAAARHGGGGYDFSYCYDNVRDYIKSFDVSQINQETLVNDELPASSYPMFSTPGQMGHDLYDAGFKVFSLSNNHTYDKGAQGLSATVSFWEQMPEDVYISGIYPDGTDYTNIAVQEVNGMKIAHLAYTEMTNGLPKPQGSQYHVVLTSQTDIIQSQLQLARSLADIVIVNVHWGTEYSHYENDIQKQLAQNMANWGADLIVGTHPHVVQNAQWLTAEDGRTAFVAYSLGNYLSTQNKPETMVGAALECEFVKEVNEEGETVTRVENPKIKPVITHYDSNYSNARVYMYENYTPELAEGHGINAWAPQFGIEYINQLMTNYVSAEFLVM